MAARKRPSLKGRGASIFLSGSEPTARQPAGIPVRPNTIKPEHQKAGRQSGKTESSQHTGVMVSPNAGMPVNGYSGRKEKATFYLPEELLFGLEVLWRDLRIMTRSKVTKSDIVQAAVERAAKEFQKAGPDSHLLKELGLEVNGTTKSRM